MQALKRHEKSFHLAPSKDHICDICSQAFTHKDTLKKHILTHDKVDRNGDKRLNPFNDRKCDKQIL